jgi:LPS export ABC transporter protein LptC
MKSVFLWVWCAAAVLFTGCEEKTSPSVIATLDSKSLPQQQSWNSTIVVSDSGRISAIIVAGYICVYDQTQQTLMSQGVKVRFFNREGKQTSVLTSDEGTVDETNNNLEARKNVVVVSSDSSHMFTEQLFWDNQRQLIHTPDYVRIITLKEKMQGHGFESDPSLKHYRVFRVTGQTEAK